MINHEYWCPFSCWLIVRNASWTLALDVGSFLCKHPLCPKLNFCEPLWNHVMVYCSEEWSILFTFLCTEFPTLVLHSPEFMSILTYVNTICQHNDNSLFGRPNLTFYLYSINSFYRWFAAKSWTPPASYKYLYFVEFF